jgi:hypothetical protein
MQTLEQLKGELASAIALCERYARPAHAVRNCPSDSENETQAWRRRQNLEYQIRQLENNEKIY